MPDPEKNLDRSEIQGAPSRPSCAEKDLQIAHQVIWIACSSALRRPIRRTASLP
jgi:hypothetical protein